MSISHSAFKLVASQLVQWQTVHCMVLIDWLAGKKLQYDACWYIFIVTSLQLEWGSKPILDGAACCHSVLIAGMMGLAVRAHQIDGSASSLSRKKNPNK